MEEKSAQHFRYFLHEWFEVHQRDLPWRGTTDPYKVWLSEIILQQTRVVQGLPYYLRFIEHFPTVTSLAEAEEVLVLKLWQGLGYYSRAKNLHHTAKHIAFQLKGLFPDSYTELIKLKGIGDYTASAIASFCYGEARAVLDGNVYRVLSRVFGITTPINTPQGASEFKALATELLDLKAPGHYNQAIMEFGALACTPQQPLCNTCGLKEVCWAYRQDEVGNLPVKLKKLRIKKRWFNYLVWIDPEGHTLLQQRQGKDIWQGLYEFPLIETSEAVDATQLASLLGEEGANLTMSLYNAEPIVHKLTHQHLYTFFWILLSPTPLEKSVLISHLPHYPVSALTANFIDKFWQL